MKDHKARTFSGAVTDPDLAGCNFDFRVVNFNHKGDMSRNVNVCKSEHTPLALRPIGYARKAVRDD
jgi:hypothetical protein